MMRVGGALLLTVLITWTDGKSLHNYTTDYTKAHLTSGVHHWQGVQDFKDRLTRLQEAVTDISMNPASSLEMLCSTVDCHLADGCKKHIFYAMCKACCGSGDSKNAEPATLKAAIDQETGNPFLAQTNQMFLKSIRWLGLHSVYNMINSRTDRAGESINDLEAITSVINNFNWINNSPLQSPMNINLNHEAICGYYLPERGEGRVVGGRPVKTGGRYPWQLSLATGFFGFFYQHRCGAALIGDRWVLTAAHCMQSMGIADTYVMAGFLAVNNRDTAQIKKIRKIHVHENFVGELYEQDIALLELEEPMTFNSIVLPVCLPPPLKDHTDQTATLTGWGRKWNDGPLSDQLNEVQLPVVNNERCMSWYESTGSRQLIPDSTFLCAGYENGMRDACNGDSGGPLVSFRDNRRAELIGLVSWGIGCGVQGRPGVYTRVSRFIDWIHGKMAMGDAYSSPPDSLQSFPLGGPPPPNMPPYPFPSAGGPPLGPPPPPAMGMPPMGRSAALLDQPKEETAADVP